MEEFKLPKFLNSEEKYNKLIHEADTLKKFEDISLKLLADEELEMSSILTLMKIIELDVILVNQLTEVTALMEMTESFIRYVSTFLENGKMLWKMLWKVVFWKSKGIMENNFVVKFKHFFCVF